MSTTKEHAARIRQTLKKEHGWNSKQVSVRMEQFSLGSAINVVIKDPEVDFETVEKIANEAESIRRCEMTGEILGGGNRYIHVKHSDEARDELAARWEKQVQAAMDTAKELETNLHANIEGAEGWSVAQNGTGYGFQLWGPDRIEQEFNTSAKCAAYVLAMRYKPEAPKADASTVAGDPVADWLDRYENADWSPFDMVQEAADLLRKVREDATAGENLRDFEIVPHRN